MKTSIEPIVYSADEAARVLRIRPGLMLEKLKRGEIPAHREGCNWKIPKVLLQVHIENEAIREAKERRELYEKAQDKGGQA